MIRIRLGVWHSHHLSVVGVSGPAADHCYQHRLHILRLCSVSASPHQRARPQDEGQLVVMGRGPSGREGITMSSLCPCRPGVALQETEGAFALYLMGVFLMNHIRHLLQCSLAGCGLFAHWIATLRAAKEEVCLPYFACPSILQCSRLVSRHLCGCKVTLTISAVSSQVCVRWWSWSQASL